MNRFKFTVFLDVDDVIHSFHEYVNGILTSLIGKRIEPGFKPSDYLYSEVHTHFGKVFESLPINWPQLVKLEPGGRDFVDSLIRRGGKIILLTSLPSVSAPARLKALARDGIRYEEIYFTHGAKKSDFINALQNKVVGPQFFVDDYSKNCLDVVENTTIRNVHCYKTPYNKEFNGRLLSLLLAASPEAKPIAENLTDMYLNVLNQIDSLLTKEA
jgi:hypothetical protein